MHESINLGQNAVLGRGRSGVVYRRRDGGGQDVARKVFVGESASKAVHYLLSGAANPYGWNADAVRCALLRRQIVGGLVQHWFGPMLRVADAVDVGWDDDARVYFLDALFVKGRPAALHHPFSVSRDHEYRSLREQVMRPLQRKLAEAGLDGLVWQAGRGNPVALNNFLRLPGDELSWAWIDLESGVPALVPINPIDLLVFYLPKSWHHGRPLFDDVDIGKLRAWLADHHAGLQRTLGREGLETLVTRVADLEAHQDRWRRLTRLQRSIAHRVAEGRITKQQADQYSAKPRRWYAREFFLMLRSALRGISRRLARWSRAVLRFDYPGALRAVGRFMTSQAYRSEVAHRYVAARIGRWESRGQLNTDSTRSLREALDREGAGSYITDFGVHVAIKPAIKVLQWGVVPSLFAAGLIGPAMMGTLIVFGGMLGRTIYTLGRMIQAALRGDRVPWVAMLVGFAPALGNVAYPAQIVYEGTERGGRLAAFIIYDSVTRVGELVPIWGGRDTVTEHCFNRLGDLIVRDRTP